MSFLNVFVHRPHITVLPSCLFNGGQAALAQANRRPWGIVESRREEMTHFYSLTVTKISWMLTHSMTLYETYAGGTVIWSRLHFGFFDYSLFERF